MENAMRELTVSLDKFKKGMKMRKEKIINLN